VGGGRGLSLYLTHRANFENRLKHEELVETKLFNYIVKRACVKLSVPFQNLKNHDNIPYKIGQNLAQKVTF
jgi:hypothetical protein